jgi:hypothetical protein
MDSSSSSGTPVCYKYQNIHCLRSYTVKNYQSKCGVHLEGRIRVLPGAHFFTCITLFDGRVPPEVIGDYCDR